MIYLPFKKVSKSFDCLVKHTLDQLGFNALVVDEELGTVLREVGRQIGCLNNIKLPQSQNALRKNTGLYSSVVITNSMYKYCW